jgi:prepilin-type N-terminal cleavage/methylation domain-containing protein
MTAREVFPNQLSRRFPSKARGFTLVEVMLSTLLVCVGLASITAMNTRSFRTVRATRQATAASQVLQQRVEAMREKPWAEVASSAALARLIAVPAESSRELLTDRTSVETITVAVVEPSATGPQPGNRWFRVRREHRTVTIIQEGDFTREPTLFIKGEVSWNDAGKQNVRTFRTVICRAGLTRSGVFGSSVGRRTAALPSASSPVPLP